MSKPNKIPQAAARHSPEFFHLKQSLAYFDKLLHVSEAKLSTAEHTEIACMLVALTRLSCEHCHSHVTTDG